MKDKKSIIALFIVAIIGIAGFTLAYFSNSDTIENEFITKEYGSTYTEEFVSPDNWLPGDTTNKTVVVENTGEVDQAVRISVNESWTTHNNETLNGWIHPDGTKSTHTSTSELETDERVAILNLANTSDWTKVGDYYYYNYKLAPGESTTSFLESVTFNPKTKLDDTCETSIVGNTETITCNSSGNDYDNATYTLTFTIETVQYNKFAAAWNTGNTVTIAEERPVPASQYLANNATNATGTGYNNATKGNMFTFSHTVNGNTVNETRYIGDNPNNYVKFNCDDDGTNCETWRILGLFDVERPDPNDNTQTITETRIKLVRGSLFSTSMVWDDNTDGEYKSDWTDANASLKNFLNGDYYNRIGAAATYGLKASARVMIDDSKFYLGALTYDSGYGTTEKIYAEERGNNVCGSCNSDTTKLTWIGKVGLMYPSDEYIIYGNRVAATCYDNPSGCSRSYALIGWIYNSNKLNGSIKDTWLLSTGVDNGKTVLFVSSSGYLNAVSVVNRYSIGVRPVVYLKSNIKIADGTGEVGSPYTLEEIQ